MDKIQSANNQPFATIEKDNQVEIQELETDNITSRSEKCLLQTKHRVTFSSEIEEYENEASEVDSVVSTDDDDEAIEKEITEIIERNEIPPIEQLNFKIDGLVKRISIEEIYSNDDDNLPDDNDYTTELVLVDEIEVFSGEKQQSETNEITTPPPLVPIDSTNLPESNNSLNVISIQVEEKKRPPFLRKPNENESLPCRVCNKKNSSSSARYTGQRLNQKRPATSQPSRATSSNFPRNMAKKTTNNDDLLKIHLNVRACCENKYLDNNRLPRYNGYISQYGLSKDLLEMREINRQKYLEKRAQREREIMRAKQEIAHLNELAFRQWLVRKSHSSRPKYKNMYDIVEPKLKIKYNPSAKFRKSSENVEY